MNKKISCQNCLKPMGEIRDASLRKGMAVLCKDCWANLNLAAKKKDTASEIYNSLFGGLHK